MPTNTCAECGAPCKRAGSKFCSPSCRDAFHRRRRVRGAMLYDLWMEHRFNRKAAADSHTLAVMGNLARAFRDSDVALRDGRQSWDIDLVLSTPLAFGKEGDKR